MIRFRAGMCCAVMPMPRGISRKVPPASRFVFSLIDAASNSIGAGAVGDCAATKPLMAHEANNAEAD